MSINLSHDVISFQINDESHIRGKFSSLARPRQRLEGKIGQCDNFEIYFANKEETTVTRLEEERRKERKILIFGGRWYQFFLQNIEDWTETCNFRY